MPAAASKQVTLPSEGVRTFFAVELESPHVIGRARLLIEQIVGEIGFHPGHAFASPVQPALQALFASIIQPVIGFPPPLRGELLRAHGELFLVFGVKVGVQLLAFRSDSRGALGLLDGCTLGGRWTAGSKR